jgi:hypothetical protein
MVLFALNDQLFWQNINFLQQSRSLLDLIPLMDVTLLLAKGKGKTLVITGFDILRMS